MRFEDIEVWGKILTKIYDTSKNKMKSVVSQNLSEEIKKIKN